MSQKHAPLLVSIVAAGMEAPEHGEGCPEAVPCPQQKAEQLAWLRTLYLMFLILHESFVLSFMLYIIIIIMKLLFREQHATNMLTHPHTHTYTHTHIHTHTHTPTHTHVT